MLPRMTVTARSAYHHGDLRQALLDASVALIEERGLDDFTLREVARRAGVSPNAPYHHFTDRDALVTALCVESFTMLRAALEASIVGRHQPVEQLRRLAAAYVRWALEHPARFRVMWRPELRGEGPLGADASVPEADAFGVLLRVIDEGRRAKVLAPGDRQAVALTAWSTVHGLATLLLDGPLAGSPIDGEAVADDVTRRLMRGLAARR
jgi:AcrR family transcriptional regulator